MDTRPRAVDGNPQPLRFVRHNFAVHVYDTLAFYVEYNGDGFFASQHRNTTSPSYVDSIPRERWPTAGYSSVANLPGPAKLRWTSLDGARHTAEIDFPRIFADGLTLYTAPDSELTAGMYHQGISTNPEIHLEVNNRTVRVYQRARMSTRSEQVPGNRYSNNRSDLFWWLSSTTEPTGVCQRIRIPASGCQSHSSASRWRPVGGCRWSNRHRLIQVAAAVLPVTAVM